MKTNRLWAARRAVIGLVACCIAATLWTAATMYGQPKSKPSQDEIAAITKADSTDEADGAKEELVEGELRWDVGRVFDLKGVTVDGKEFDWSVYKGKIVLIDFWASWCGPCIAEVPNMIKAYERFKPSGFEIVSVGIGESNERTKKGMVDHKMVWVSLSEDLTAKAAPAGTPKLSEYYGIQGIPTMFLVGRNGRVIVNEDRQIRSGRLIGTLEKILADEKETYRGRP